MSEPACLIVNPTAGGGRAARTADAVTRALQDHGLRLRTVVARGRDHVGELAATAAQAGETVVTLGGDGMVGAAAEGLRGTPGARLGIVPAGRGNDLARVLGIPRDPAGACAVVAGGTAHPFDLGEVDGRVFVGIASVGFDSEANRIANQAPAWLGSGVYAYGALRALLRWRHASFRVELSGGAGPTTLEFRGYSVALANSRCFGGGMRLAPGAMLDDGLLDIVAIERMARVRYLLNLPRVFLGAHLGVPGVHLERASEVLVSADRPMTMYADGDPIGELPVRVRVLPAAISVIAPRVVAAFGALAHDRTAQSSRDREGESAAPESVAPGTPCVIQPGPAPAPA